ncbi:ribonuclease P protein component [Rhodoblastus acidophilus]|uniref:Ribonuclease P protein component n=1 Tax=Rhodoblastus acidophilus TaxID=1074 RepID=A0A6N8DJX9_RHOAC|nr:ribonuclease P protein component [Rhodoblastus acidophilus]MTV29531.1 ribonuclease P protein component [Rhodoblastus acidophilus]
MPRPGDGESSSRRPSALAEGAALACPERLKKRAEFLAAAKGRRQHQRCFTMQARRRSEAQGDAPRFGFTVTKKTGNSVIRNRIRRRFREIVRLHAAGDARPGMDYVLVGRIDALTAGFDDLRREFLSALHKIHSAERKPDR